MRILFALAAPPQAGWLSVLFCVCLPYEQAVVVDDSPQMIVNTFLGLHK